QDLDARRRDLVALVSENQQKAMPARAQPAFARVEGDQAALDLLAEMDQSAGRLAGEQQDLLALVDYAISQERLRTDGLRDGVAGSVGLWQPEWQPEAPAAASRDETPVKSGASEWLESGRV